MLDALPADVRASSELFPSFIALEDTLGAHPLPDDIRLLCARVSEPHLPPLRSAVPMWSVQTDKLLRPLKALSKRVNLEVHLN
jgi:hypothetical protein